MIGKCIRNTGVFFILLLMGTVILSAWTSCADAAGSPADISGAELKPSELYARHAVLMDAESGRVLFSKSGDEEAPMASTTKIMTCILALEKGTLTDEVTAGSEAVSQPEVRLGMKKGQKFLLRDLLYSLMLESHNDTAVAIAEHIGGSVEGFADMMNEKAAELQCADTYFITPNGLDAEDENGIHHTSAADLARIMKYCIMGSPAREKFLEITRTDTYTFSDCSSERSYTCRNHNVFLKMMEGALTGKTGFTADAGYCYVGALESRGRTFIVALLACGWPDNKAYKWSDTRKLMTYGMENYTYQEAGPSENPYFVAVANGYTEGYPAGRAVNIPVYEKGDPVRVLLRKGEQIERELKIDRKISAPVKEGECLGEAVYTAGGAGIASYPVIAGETAEKRTFCVCLRYISERLLLWRNM